MTEDAAAAEARGVLLPDGVPPVVPREVEMSRPNLLLVITCIAASAFIVPLAIAQQRSPDLDITALPRPTDEDPVPSGSTQSSSGGGIVVGERPRSPLGVRLLRLEPSPCVVGEPISYDVEIRNITRTTVTLPWSLDPRDEGEAMPGFFPVLSLGLEFTEQRTRGALRGSERLYGDTFKPFTTKLLRPGEVLVVRSGGQCNTTAVLDARGSGVRLLRVTARVGVHNHRDLAGVRALSNNTMLLQIEWTETP